MQFFDVHTHRSDNKVGIQNLLSNFDSVPDDGLFSVGLHPWYLEEPKIESHFLKLQAAAVLPQVLEIGECGLDKACETNLYTQKMWLIRQVQLAMIIRKPLILHCVKAFDESIEILNDLKVDVPLIFHGFAKSRELADRLLSEGYYLSFGKHLQNENVQDVFKQLPLDRIFLETDSADIGIEEIYRIASASKNSDVNQLQSSLLSNAEKVFGSFLKNE